MPRFGGRGLWVPEPEFELRSPSLSVTFVLVLEDMCHQSLWGVGGGKLLKGPPGTLASLVR